MKTAALTTYSGPGRIAITVGQPRGAPAGFRIYRKLAPTRDMLSLAEATYRERFFRDILGKLDPQATWDELHGLAAGAEPVLLCFERPPFTPCNWCHRRMVAEWFKSTLGHDVDELTPETAEEKAATAAKRAEDAKPAGGSLLRVATNVGDQVWRIRFEIEAFWNRLGIAMTWAWSGCPDRIREALDDDRFTEWHQLQRRYREVY